MDVAGFDDRSAPQKILDIAFLLAGDRIDHHDHHSLRKCLRKGDTASFGHDNIGKIHEFVDKIDVAEKVQRPFEHMLIVGKPSVSQMRSIAERS